MSLRNIIIPPDHEKVLFEYIIPKIENEVLIGARRGLNRWFLSLRSGGDGAKAGRAVLRRAAHSMAVGPGNLGLGGHMPPAYLWRAKVRDNLISRMNQNGRVVRSVRNGYWFERDAPKDAQRGPRARMLKTLQNESENLQTNCNSV